MIQGNKPETAANRNERKRVDPPNAKHDYTATERSKRRNARFTEEGGKRLPFMCRAEDGHRLAFLLERGYATNQTEILRKLISEEAARLGFEDQAD